MKSSFKSSKLNVENYPAWITESINENYIRGPIYIYRGFIIYKVYYGGEGWKWEAELATATKYHENCLNTIAYNKTTKECMGGGYFSDDTKASLIDLIDTILDNDDENYVFGIVNAFLPDAFTIENNEVVYNLKYVTENSDGLGEYKNGYETTVKIYHI